MVLGTAYLDAEGYYSFLNDFHSSFDVVSAQISIEQSYQASVHRLVFLNLKMTTQHFMYLSLWLACTNKNLALCIYCTICNVAAEVVNEYY